MFVTLKTENSNMRTIKAVPARASQGQARVLLADDCLMALCRPSARHREADGVQCVARHQGD